MKDQKESILWLLYRIRPRRALDVESIRKGWRIKNWQTVLRLCLILQHDGKIIGAKTPNGLVFWVDFTEDREQAIRLPYKLPNKVIEGTVSSPPPPKLRKLISEQER